MSLLRGIVVVCFVILQNQVLVKSSAARNKCDKTSGSFWCQKDQICIPSGYVCDGESDCGDNEDELNCTVLNGTACLADMFLCSDTDQCISKSLLCNGVIDCVYGEDELGCNKNFTAIESTNSSEDTADSCKSNEFRCLESSVRICIPFENICNGIDDCVDRSDEIDCKTRCCGEDKNFFEGFFWFPCFLKSWVCGGQTACSNSFSESNCDKNVSSCPINMFFCHESYYRECIEETLVCDGNQDCVLNEDEINCRINSTHCIGPYIACPDSDNCIKGGDICNGFNECFNNWDETNCGENFTSCPANWFLCDESLNKMCIEDQHVCNVKRHCESNEDETKCRLNSTHCKGPHVACPNSEDCLVESHVWHGFNECGNYSHELNCCGNLTSCPNNYYLCNDWPKRKCIGKYSVCDGRQDCESNEDETNCRINSTHCKGPYIPCPESLKCLKEEDLWHGIIECGNKSDDSHCCKNLTSCPDTYFLCNEGPKKKCIRKDYVCDGWKNCELNEDEKNCRINSTHCQGDLLACPHSLECLGRSNVGYGFQECGNSSQETNCCGNLTSCPQNYFFCNDWPKRKCIHERYVCDGNKDCKLGEDEANCRINLPSCKGPYIPCLHLPNLKCILQRDICNGYNDCGNNWDEMQCFGSVTVNCNTTQFLCPGEDHCVDLHYLCDNLPGCENRQDDSNCPPQCNSDEFRCAACSCIKRKQICDGYQDCMDNEDETNCIRRGVLTKETNPWKLLDRNCLKNYPRALDSFVKLRDNDSSVYLTFSNFVRNANLFYSRFRHAHMFTPFAKLEAFLENNDFTNFLNSTNSSIQILIYLDKRNGQHFEKVNESSFSKIIAEVAKFNVKTKGLVGGVYLPIRNVSDSEYFTEEGFQTAENLSIPLGILWQNCYSLGLNDYETSFLKKLKFVTCYEGTIYSFFVSTKEDEPEAAAEKSMAVGFEFKKRARMADIKAEIFIMIDYATQSRRNFQRFWCHIVDIVIRNKHYPRVIMTPSFSHSKYHLSSWWKFLGESDEQDTLIEIFDYLPGVLDIENCSNICEPCDRLLDCCSGFCEAIFYMNSEIKLCVPINHTSECLLIFNTNGQNINEKLEVNEAVSIQTWIAIITALLLVLLVGVALSVYIVRKKLSEKYVTKQDIERFLDGSDNCEYNAGVLHTSEMIDVIPYDKSLEVSRDVFEIYEHITLGFGEFGVVYKGRLEDQYVAVKTVKQGVEKIYLKSLMLELKILMLIRNHENIINLVGAQTSKLAAGRLYLFLEFCPLGNLLEFLRRHRDTFGCKENCAEEPGEIVTTTHLLKWSLQIASAVSYIADKQIIHGDIAARNILVHSVETVKLSDFGLSRRIYEYANYVKKSQEPLPWRHMSIEALRDLTFSVQSDVWSFGVTMWEIFSLGQTPFPGYTWSEDFLQLLEGGLCPLCPEYANDSIYSIMSSCWNVNLQNRPSMKSIRSSLCSTFEQMPSANTYVLPVDISSQISV